MYIIYHLGKNVLSQNTQERLNGCEWRCFFDPRWYSYSIYQQELTGPCQSAKLWTFLRLTKAKMSACIRPRWHWYKCSLHQHFNTLSIIRSNMQWQRHVSEKLRRLISRKPCSHTTLISSALIRSLHRRAFFWIFRVLLVLMSLCFEKLHDSMKSPCCSDAD